MNEITIGDKVYISAKRAAEITGYARDYVGQLCREGHVDAKMVGRSWYVHEASIRAHRFGAEAASPTKGPVVSSEEEGEESETAQDASAEGTESDQEGTEASDSWKKPTYTAETPELLPEMSAPSIEELLPPAEETLTDMQAAWREWFDQKQRNLQTPEIESPEVIESRYDEIISDEISHDTQEIEENEAPEEIIETSVPFQNLEQDSEPEEEYEKAEEEDESGGDVEENAEEEERVAIQYIPPVRPPEPVRTLTAVSHVDIAPVTPTARYSGEYAAPQAVSGRIIHERVLPKNKPKKGTGSWKSSSKSARSTSNAPVIALLVGISFVAITVALIGTGYASRYLKTLPAEHNPVINFLLGTREFSR